MRQSAPGQKRRNQKSNSKSMLGIDKKQPTNLPAHDPAYAMQYGCSRKTGQKTGGHFWNPPAYCERRIVPYGGERWVDVGLCKECFRHKSKTCPAASLDKIQFENGKPIYDEPCNRRSKRVPRRVEPAAASRRVSRRQS